MRILFQGDSITDGGGDKSNPAEAHVLGNAYPRYAAERIQQMFPERRFEFLNYGISGNQTKDIVARAKTDIIDVEPDLTSLLVGINDVWHHFGDRDWIPDDVFEARYTEIIRAIKNNGSILIILEPFFVPVDEDEQKFLIDLPRKRSIIRKLARRYADAYIPLDGLFAAECIGADPTEFSADGVHPSAAGAEFIGKIYAETAAPLIRAYFALGKK